MHAECASIQVQKFDSCTGWFFLPTALLSTFQLYCCKAIMLLIIASTDLVASTDIKTHDSELRGQEEPATTEWVIYREHCQKNSLML